MLMKTQFDYFYVAPEHDAIDKRLVNWAEWVKVRTPSGVAPVWKLGKPAGRQWHYPELRPTCDLLDAAAMEKAVYALPKRHRDALRWCYVYKYGEAKFRREAGLTQDGLMRLLSEARTMLMNRKA